MPRLFPWLGLTLLLAVTTLVGGGPPRYGPALPLLATLAVGLELAAVPLAGVGYFSSAFAPIFALGLLANPTAGACALIAGVAARSVLRRGPALAALADLIPGLACLAVLAFVPSAVAGLVVYLPLALKLPEKLLGDRAPLAWQRHRDMIAVYTLGVAGLGPALWLLCAQAPWHGLWLAPILLGLHRAAQLDLLRLEVLDRELLEVRERQSREALRRTREELTLERDERRVLEELYAAMALSESVAEMRSRIEASVHELIPCERVEAVLEGGPEGPGARLPMGGEGTLYVERQSGPFSPEERHILTTVAGAGGLGLQSVGRYHKVKIWAQRQDFLLEGARQLASGLAAEEARRRFQELVRLTIPHQRGALLPPDSPDALARKATSLKQAVLEPNRLAAPLVTEERVVGVVVLESDEGFTEEQAKVLQTLAYQAAVALENARVHEQLKESQAQLIQSSKMAAVGQLAAGVAHELNTPLGTVLLGLSARLEAGPDRTLEKVHRAATRAKEIVAKLLYYARDARLARVPTDLNQVVRDTLELLGSQLNLDNVRVETDLHEIPLVPGNQNELQQVLTNLMINARDAGKRILVRSRADHEGALVEVIDDGPGVPEELREKIFDPFFTTKPVGSGTGLGLSTSLQIVLAHDGKLELGPGPGGHFRLWLPA